jgi:hypothetical protein
MAFAADNAWTVVAWNESSAAAQFSVALPGATSTASAVSTDATHDLAAAAPPARTSTGSWLVDLPAGAIGTYTFR